MFVGSDIKYTAKITLKEALCGCIIYVPTLDSGSLTLDYIGEIVSPATLKRIPRQGLPFPKEPSRRGDLVINFDIRFPVKLSQQTRRILADIL